jgi:hypothetical protein
VKNTINLLSVASKPLTYWEKFYYWALTIGRYIVIVTEIIVLLAFFYKFKVDYDLSSVQNSLKNDVAVLKENAPQEKAIQTYQKQARAQNTILAGQQKIGALFSHSLGLVPSQITITAVFLSNDQTIEIDGSIPGITSSQLNTIQSLANTFKSDSNYTNVNLYNVQTDSGSNATNFKLSASIST